MAENREYVTAADERGSVNISEEVIAVVAGSAAAEVDGVASLYPTPTRDINGLLGKKSFSRSAKITIAEKSVTVDVYLTAALGAAVNEVGAAAQRAVAGAVEAATGLHVAAVNVHICGVAPLRGR